MGDSGFEAVHPDALLALVGPDRRVLDELWSCELISSDHQSKGPLAYL